MNRKDAITRGLRDGIPIALGYYAVAFSIGIIAQKAGINAITGFFSSLFTRASAGEYGVYSLILVNATYSEVFLISIITNLRYLLMNTALSQKIAPKTPLYKRILLGICCTDEIFGIAIAQEGFVRPAYVYSAMFIAAIFWSLGTATGIVAGNILPPNVVSALSVALYGMFIAIIIPVGKKDHAVLITIIISFIVSFIVDYIPYINTISAGTKTIVLTLVIASLAALIKPVKEADNDSETV